MKEAFPMVPGPTDEVVFTAVGAGAEVAKAVITPAIAFLLIAWIGFRWLRNKGAQKA